MLFAWLSRHILIYGQHRSKKLCKICAQTQRYRLLFLLNRDNKFTIGFYHRPLVHEIETMILIIICLSRYIIIYGKHQNNKYNVMHSQTHQYRAENSLNQITNCAVQLTIGRLWSHLTLYVYTPNTSAAQDTSYSTLQVTL